MTDSNTTELPRHRQQSGLSAGVTLMDDAGAECLTLKRRLEWVSEALSSQGRRRFQVEPHLGSGGSLSRCRQPEAGAVHLSRRVCCAEGEAEASHASERASMTTQLADDIVLVEGDGVRHSSCGGVCDTLSVESTRPHRRGEAEF